MSEMVDRVAEAIMGELGFPERMARAAIEAMREPTRAMTNVSQVKDYTEGFGTIDKVTPDTAADLWRDMIDEALK